ncbi:MAG: tetratricopeptide repeat protein [Desulfobacterales bacterium]
MNLNRILWAAVLAVSLCVTGCAASKVQQENGEKKPSAGSESAEQESLELPVHLAARSGGGHYYYFILAQLEAKSGRMQQAAGMLEKAVQSAPDEPVLKKELTLVYLELGHEKKALASAESLLDRKPDNAEALILAASIRQAAGKEKEAKEAYEKVLTKDPDRKNIYLALARLYLRSRQYKEAAELLEPFVKRFPQNYTGFYFLAEAYSGMDELDDAAEAYEKSLELEPGLLESRVRLIEIYTNQEKVKEAEEHYEKLLERHPDNLAAAAELGLLYEKQGEKQKAQDLWSEMGGQLESDSDAVTEVVRKLLGRNRYEDALTVLSELLKKFPENQELNYYAGAAAYMTDQFDKALKHFKAIKPGNDFYKDAVIHRAVILNRQDNTGEAISVLESAMEQAGENQRKDLVPYLSGFYQKQGKYGRAEELLVEGLSREPENTVLHYEMGVLYDRMGDTEAAIDKMKLVIEMDPENADAYNYLGYTYADRDMRLDEAESLVRRALEIDPDNGFILDSMGWVYYRKGDYERAKEYIEKALDRVSDDPAILEHMGDVSLKLDEPEKALDYYRRAVENTESEEDRQELQNKIESVQNSEEEN